MSELDTLPLPPIIPGLSVHPQLKDARLRVDPKSNARYLLQEDVDEGHIRILKMNRLKAKNGFDDWLYLVIADALNAAAADDNVWVVVLTGEGEVRRFHIYKGL